MTKVISPEVVKLNISGKIHNRFHESLLLPVEENPLPSQKVANEEPAHLRFDGDEEYYIDEIIRCRTWKGERQALVEWTGNLTIEWTSLSNLQDAVALNNWEAKWGSAELNNEPISRVKKEVMG